MDMEKIHRFNELWRSKQSLSEEIKQIEASLDEIESEIVDEMSEAGVDKVSADGRTIYLKRSFFAKAGGEDPVRSLEDAGMRQCLSVGHQKLRALVSEHVKSFLENAPGASVEQAMEPFYQQYPTLRGVVFAGEKWELGSRSA